MARHGLILSQDGAMPYTNLLEAWLALFGTIFYNFLHKMGSGPRTRKIETCYRALISNSAHFSFGSFLIRQKYKQKTKEKQKRIVQKQVLRIKNSIGQNASEQKSSLSGLFRPSHLPYKAKIRKILIFPIIFYFPYFPYYPLLGGMPTLFLKTLCRTLGEARRLGATSQDISLDLAAGSLVLL